MEGILEGLLYVQGDAGLTLKDVMSILNISEDEAKELIYKLKKSYEEENRGLRLSYLGNTFKLTTKKEHKVYYQKLIDIREKNKISWKDDELKKQYDELMEQLIETAKNSTTS